MCKFRVGLLSALMVFALGNCVFAQVEKINIAEIEEPKHDLRIAAEPAKSAHDLLHFGDVVDVDVVGSIEYDWRGKVSPEGFISGFPFPSDPIRAFCQKESDLEIVIAKTLSKFLRNPQVKVTLLERPSRTDAVLIGAVQQPSRIRMKRPVRLNEVLIVGGGLTDQISGTIRIFRQNRLSCAAYFGAISSDDPLDIRSAGKGLIDVSSMIVEPNEVLSVRIMDLLKGDAKANPEILYGDVVTVEKADSVYVIGAVGNPSRIVYREGLTILRAINSNGGVSKTADSHNIKIYRTENGLTQTIIANLEAIATGKIADIPVKPKDIIEVSGKGQASDRAPELPEEVEQIAMEALPLRIIE